MSKRKSMVTVRRSALPTAPICQCGHFDVLHDPDAGCVAAACKCKHFRLSSRVRAPSTQPRESR